MPGCGRSKMEKAKKYKKNVIFFYVHSRLDQNVLVVHRPFPAQLALQPFYFSLQLYHVAVRHVDQVKPRLFRVAILAQPLAVAVVGPVSTCVDAVENAQIARHVPRHPSKRQDHAAIGTLAFARFPQR